MTSVVTQAFPVTSPKEPLSSILRPAIFNVVTANASHETSLEKVFNAYSVARPSPMNSRLLTLTENTATDPSSDRFGLTAPPDITARHLAVSVNIHAFQRLEAAFTGHTVLLNELREVHATVIQVKNGIDTTSPYDIPNIRPYLGLMAYVSDRNTSIANLYAAEIRRCVVTLYGGSLTLQEVDEHLSERWPEFKRTYPATFNKICSQVFNVCESRRAHLSIVGGAIPIHIINDVFKEILPKLGTGFECIQKALVDAEANSEERIHDRDLLTPVPVQAVTVDSASMARLLLQANTLHQIGVNHQRNMTAAYARGVKDGEAARNEEEYQNQLKAAVTDRLDQVFETAYQAGLENGTLQREEEALKTAQKEGHHIGYQEGLNIGYREGLNEGKRYATQGAENEGYRRGYAAQCVDRDERADFILLERGIQQGAEAAAALRAAALADLNSAWEARFNEISQALNEQGQKLVAAERRASKKLEELADLRTRHAQLVGQKAQSEEAHHQLEHVSGQRIKQLEEEFARAQAERDRGEKIQEALSAELALLQQETPRLHFLATYHALSKNEPIQAYNSAQKYIVSFIMENLGALLPASNDGDGLRVSAAISLTNQFLRARGNDYLASTDAFEAMHEKALKYYFTDEAHRDSISLAIQNAYGSDWNQPMSIDRNTEAVMTRLRVMWFPSAPRAATRPVKNTAPTGTPAAVKKK